MKSELIGYNIGVIQIGRHLQTGGQTSDALLYLSYLALNNFFRYVDASFRFSKHL